MNESIRRCVVWRGNTVVSVALVLTALLAASVSEAQPTPQKKSIWDRVTFDLNAGAPKLANGEFKVQGDAMAGYADDKFGAVVRGSLSYYDTGGALGTTETLRESTSGDAWYVFGRPEDRFRFEVRGSGGALMYDTDYYIPAGLRNPSSLLGRGMLMAGVRLRPEDTLNLHASLGGGAQYETFDMLSTDPKDRLISDSETWSFRAEGRLLAHWAFLPGILSTRLQGEGAWFSLTRTSSYFSSQTFVTEAIYTFRQLEVRGRLSIELDAAAFAGILPFAYGGLDFISMSSDAGSNSITVPSAGVGLNKPVW